MYCGVPTKEACPCTKETDWSRIEAATGTLGTRATLLRIEHADHGFEVLVRSGRKPAEVMTEILDGFGAWARALMRG